MDTDKSRIMTVSKTSSIISHLSAVILLSLLGVGLTGCDLLGAKVRSAAGMPPVQRGWATVTNNGVITICKMHVADETGAYLESYSLIAMEYDYLHPGAHHRYEILVHGAPLKIRLSACNGTVLKELHDVQLADAAEMQIMVP